MAAELTLTADSARDETPFQWSFDGIDVPVIGRPGLTSEPIHVYINLYANWSLIYIWFALIDSILNQLSITLIQFLILINSNSLSIS